jgi:hypothetical protein
MKLKYLVVALLTVAPLSLMASTIHVSGLTVRNQGKITQTLRAKFPDAQVHVDVKKQSVAVDSQTTNVSGDEIIRTLQNEKIAGLNFPNTDVPAAPSVSPVVTPTITPTK